LVNFGPRLQKNCLLRIIMINFEEKGRRKWFSAWFGKFWTTTECKNGSMRILVNFVQSWMKKRFKAYFDQLWKQMAEEILQCVFWSMFDNMARKKLFKAYFSKFLTYNGWKIGLCKFGQFGENGWEKQFNAYFSKLAQKRPNSVLFVFWFNLHNEDGEKNCSMRILSIIKNKLLKTGKRVIWLIFDNKWWLNACFGQKRLKILCNVPLANLGLKGVKSCSSRILINF
jgi:hypothetical protein